MKPVHYIITAYWYWKEKWRSESSPFRDIIMGTYGIRKGAWTNEEDVLLRKCIENYGDGKWHLVPSRAGLNRCRKSCRLRWMNYLRPNIKRGEFTEDEVDLMMRLHKLLGNRWSLIAGRLPGRTANDVKNYWNTHHKDMVLEKVQKHASKWGEKLDSKTEVIKPQPWAFYKSSSGWRMKPAVEATTQSPVSTLPQPNENDGNSEWWESLFADLEGDQGTHFSIYRSSLDANLWDLLDA